ncbi:hypothetical protein AVEN_69237-1 [Araneus ventricosus]|uniref:Uncharacterized protein n=1 Tax=Araneus ventricosus TaxID=182803 RepID=A0A4Y2ES58_ARAVE|nr:hypothetical protein AVEN_69237-1 [Araneus ventricosus]
MRLPPHFYEGYDPSSEMGPTSHIIIIVPTSKSVNLLTYPTASYSRTRGVHRWTSLQKYETAWSPDQYCLRSKGNQICLMGNFCLPATTIFRFSSPLPTCTIARKRASRLF